MKITDHKIEVEKILVSTSSIDEAIESLKKLDYEVTKEELETFLKGDNKQVVINDNDLELVTGGTEWNKQLLWSSKDSVKYIYNVNDEVEVASGFGFGTTVRCVIKQLGIGYFSLANGGNAYFDTYYCENKDYTWYFYDGWKTRDLIEKK